MDRAHYTKAVHELYKRPPGVDLVTQKFKRGERVHITKNMPRTMSHFDCDIDAIVEYTYGQKYGGHSAQTYSLLLLDERGRPVGTSAWYDESHLTSVSDDLKIGLLLLKQYEESNNDD